MAVIRIAGPTFHNSWHILVFLPVRRPKIHERQKTIWAEKHINYLQYCTSCIERGVGGWGECDMYRNEYDLFGKYLIYNWWIVMSKRKIRQTDVWNPFLCAYFDDIKLALEWSSPHFQPHRHASSVDRKIFTISPQKKANLWNVWHWRWLNGILHIQTQSVHAYWEILAIN